ncbi:MAG: glycerophosphodiester phosphodiesterase family protein [Clostridia bacterium]|nr:glycerophosphodiester phosphodiesterase family protein [Clostridia bacterium]
MSKKLAFILIIIGSVIAFIGVGLLAWSFAPNMKDVKYIAHRGYSDDSIANTESAFVEAGRLPYYGIETDIRVTFDGKLVCVHDETVEYIDGTVLTVADSTLAQLTAKKLKGTENAYVCTFGNYLDICERYQKIAIVELKAIFNSTQIGRLFYSIDVEYSRDKVSFISFEMSNLLLCRSMQQDSDCQYLVSESEQIRAALDNHMNISIYWKLLNRKLVENFHENGFTVNVWTVNNRIIRTYCDVLGVDYITSDEFY